MAQPAPAPAPGPRPPRRRRRLADVRPGSAPGTLRGPDPGQARPLTLTLTRYDSGGLAETTPASLADCVASLSQPGVTWIDVEGLGDLETLTRLGERLGLHALALEDAVHGPHRPKAEAYPDHAFVVLRTARAAGEAAEEQVSLFFGASWVLTVHERSGGVFAPVRERCRTGRGPLRSSGPDYLAYALIDAVVDGYFPVLEALGERVDALEAAALAGRDGTLLGQLQEVRHDLLALRRALWPTREAITALQRGDAPGMAAETRVFLRDCHDNCVQGLELLETYRETAAALMEVYLSIQNQRLNEVMKVLTVMATLFIPLTFIASIYGMNFRNMPELDWAFGYPLVLGAMVAIAAGLLAYFRRRGWW